ncbi:MAG: hypothetical protein KDE03_07155 [Rhodobacteraceae bacterium]|nr:hypothetical protein [Paracoccaceae bacterium]
MTRILIVGNSHVAALRLGWELLKGSCRQSISVDFLAAPGRNFSKLQRGTDSRFGLLEPESVPSKTLEIMRRINRELVVDLESYDDILLVGAYFQPNQALSLLDAKGDAVDTVLANSGRLAEPFLRNRIRRIVDSAPQPEFCLALRRARVTLLLKPRQTVQAARNAGLSPAGLGAIYNLHAKLVAHRLSESGIAFLPQPIASLDGSGLTLDHFSSGSKRLSGEAHPDEDGNHMNDDFGRLCIKEYLEQLPQKAA